MRMIIMSEYIYKVYEDCNSKAHCERYVIVYQNSEYIYYITPGAKFLQYIHRRYLRDGINCRCDKLGFYKNQPSRAEIDHLNDCLEVHNIKDVISDFLRQESNAIAELTTCRAHLRSYIKSLRDGRSDVDEILKSMNLEESSDGNIHQVTQLF
jgi:hypothetical protein